jgi:hypothetical protein
VADDDLDSTLPDTLSAGERLFPPVTSLERHTADLEWEWVGDARYIDGFRRAAQVLADHVIRPRGEGSQAPGNFAAEILVMPILYCYRHWIEARLKDLWILGGQWKGDEVDPRKTHDLSVLWRHARPALEDAFPTSDREELDRVEAIVLELAAADPEAVAFRYSHGKKGQPTLSAIRQIDVEHVRGVMDKVAMTLDGCAAGMRHMLDERAEQRRGMRGSTRPRHRN